jgi:phosphoenolpyruvate phosphomutase
MMENAPPGRRLPVSVSMRPSARLRNFLQSAEPTFLMEAHDGISARIVERAGFDGIWASGLSISTALGVRDCNELSWTQVLHAVDYISEAVSVPVLVDGDTGFGNFNNARRFAAKLAQVGAAGVCLEDKLFPKLNSFIGEQQPLVTIDEFSGKLRACRDAVPPEELVIVARIEALVSGHSLAETLERAHAYHEAGADAILVHSKSVDGQEILDFLAAWRNRSPTIVVPTTYHGVGADALHEAGASVVIWANQNMRAAISAMQEVSRSIWRSRSVSQVEGSIISVPDLFDLMGYDELAVAERAYLQSPHRGS